MNEVKRESFFCLVLMISRAKGWLLQKVPAACLIFSSSTPLNCNQTNPQQDRAKMVISHLVNLGQEQLLWKCLLFNHYKDQQVPEGDLSLNVD